MQADSLKVFDAIAGTNLAQDHRFIAVKLWRNDGQHVTSNDLVRGVTEDPLSGSVPVGDHAIQVFAYDGIIRGVNDGSQLAGRAFVKSLLGDITRYLGGANHPAFMIADRGNTEGNFYA